MLLATAERFHVRSGAIAPLRVRFGEEEAHAAGRVETASHISSPIGRSAPSPSVIRALFGAGIPPVASGVTLMLLLLGAMGMAVALLLADAAGQGPRHELWRQRVVNRLRSLR